MFQRVFGVDYFLHFFERNIFWEITIFINKIALFLWG